MCVIVLDMAVHMWHNEEGLRFPMHPIVGTIGIDGSRSRAQKWAWPTVCIPLLSLLLAGCALFGGSSGGNAGSGTSLDDFISGTMPLPPGAAGAPAAPASPATPENEEMAGLEPQIEDISFTPTGEPILRTGYILRIAVTVGDRVEVNPVEVQVSDKNEITLPFVGKVDCAGLTINGLRSRLSTGYSKYFRNPEVSISFVIREAFTSPWGRVYVQGRVHREGWVSIPATRYLKVSDAIQAAGGFAQFARRDNIRVSRKNRDGKIEFFRINLEEIGRRGKTDNDMLLKSGDVVYVFETSI